MEDFFATVMQNVLVELTKANTDVVHCNYMAAVLNAAFKRDMTLLHEAHTKYIDTLRASQPASDELQRLVEANAELCERLCNETAKMEAAMAELGRLKTSIDAMQEAADAQSSAPAELARLSEEIVLLKAENTSLRLARDYYIDFANNFPSQYRAMDLIQQFYGGKSTQTGAT
jgi:hypothetical protein